MSMTRPKTSKKRRITLPKLEVTHEQIVTRSLALVDDEGHERASLTLRDGQPILRMLDARGDVRLELQLWEPGGDHPSNLIPRLNLNGGPPPFDAAKQRHQRHWLSVLPSGIVMICPNDTVSHDWPSNRRGYLHICPQQPAPQQEEESPR